jgi:hypothetical protein
MVGHRADMGEILLVWEPDCSSLRDVRTCGSKTEVAPLARHVCSTLVERTSHAGDAMSALQKQKSNKAALGPSSSGYASNRRCR